MAKTKTFEIIKDFGDKTVTKVFVKDEMQTEVTDLSLREDIEKSLSSAQTACVVAESAMNGELLALLSAARENTGLRIYIITKNIQQAAFERLKYNCIVREVSETSGNYLICDTATAFFFDRNLCGYSVCNAKTVGRLHGMFIYAFWNKAAKEFVGDVKPVAEQTFDVAPVLENDSVKIASASGLFEKAEAFAVQSKISDYLKTPADENAALYLDKNACKADTDWLLKTVGRNIIFTDTSILPLCKSGGSWYMLNGDFGKSANDGKNRSAVKMESEPVFANMHSLKDSLTYREAVGKTMFYAKDFSPIAIAESDTEECSVSYDYKKFKKIARMSETEREAEFDKIHLLVSDKLAAQVAFTVTMTVKQLSKGAVLAPVYAEYEQFSKKQAEAIRTIRTDIDKSKHTVETCATELKKIEADIADFEKRRSENEQIVKNQSETENRLQALSKELDAAKKAKAEIKKYEDEQKQQQKKIEETEGEINILRKKKKDDASAQKKLSELKAEFEVCAKKIDALRPSADCSAQEKEKAELEKLQKENRKKIDEFKKHSRDGEKLESQRQEKNKQIEAEALHRSERESLLSRAEKLPKNAETLSECKEIASVLEEFRLYVPAFDKPKYGTLYKVKSAYEYELSSDDDSDKAEAEMERAGISDVEFVSITK